MRLLTVLCTCLLFLFVPSFGLAWDLGAPVLGLVVLSIGQIFNILRLVPLSLLEGEHVASRIISLPFVFILVFAVTYFQDWLDQPHRRATLRNLGISSAVIIGLNDLWQNYRLWRVAEAARSFDEKIFDPRAWKVINHPDPVYLGLVLGGAVLSLVSLGVLLFFVWRSRQQAD